jgi:hypothetical protein
MFTLFAKDQVGTTTIVDDGFDLLEKYHELSKCLDIIFNTTSFVLCGGDSSFAIMQSIPRIIKKRFLLNGKLVIKWPAQNPYLHPTENL